MYYRVRSPVGQNLRLKEEIVQVDAIMDLERKDLFVPMEGIHIANDGKTILEMEGDALLLKQEKVWLKIPDSDICSSVFCRQLKKNCVGSGRFRPELHRFIKERE